MRRSGLVFTWVPWLAAGGVVLAAAAIGWRQAWVPIGDNAMITSMSLDTLTRNPPLVGMPTSLGLRAGVPVSHPGPLPFWIIGPPAAVLGSPGHGVLIGVAAIHLASLAAMAACARFLGNRVATPALAAVAVVMVSSGLDAPGLRAPFNPNLGVLSTLAALVAAWTVLAGRAWALPIFVATASLAAQSHVSYLPVVAALVVLVVAGVAVDLRRRGPGDPTRRSVVRRVVPVSLLVGLICWSGPIIDQLVGDGNLWSLLSSSRSLDTAGWSYGFDVLVAAIGPSPLWTGPQVGGPLPPPTGAEVALAMGAVAGVVGSAVWAWRTRDRRLLACSATVLVALLAATATSARLPNDPQALASPANRLVWWPVGAATWFALGWAVGAVLTHLVRARRRRRGREEAPAHQTAVLGVVAGSISLLVVAVAGFAALDPPDLAVERGSVTFGAVVAHASAIDEATPAGGTVRLTAPDTGLANYTLVQSLIAQLRLRGMDVQVEVVDMLGFFRAYQQDHPTEGTPDTTVLVRGEPTDPPAPPGARLLSRYDPSHPPEAYRGLRAGILYGGGFSPSEVHLLPA